MYALLSLEYEMTENTSFALEEYIALLNGLASLHEWISIREPITTLAAPKNSLFTTRTLVKTTPVNDFVTR
jgi:hypothetical protein